MLRQMDIKAEIVMQMFELLYFLFFFVGNDIVHQFEKCPTPFCSKKIIDIEAPMPQLVLLLEKSPMCKQEITFNCFLAPIMVRIFFPTA